MRLNNLLRAFGNVIKPIFSPRRFTKLISSLRNPIIYKLCVLRIDDESNNFNFLGRVICLMNGSDIAL